MATNRQEFPPRFERPYYRTEVSFGDRLCCQKDTDPATIFRGIDKQLKSAR